MTGAPFTLAFYNSARARILLLPSHNPTVSIDTVILKYRLVDLKFINVFTSGAFTERYYVEAGARSVHIGKIYLLDQDLFLNGKLTASVPCLDWKRIFALPRVDLQSKSFNEAVLFFHLTSPGRKA